MNVFLKFIVIVTFFESNAFGISHLIKCPQIQKLFSDAIISNHATHMPLIRNTKSIPKYFTGIIVKAPDGGEYIVVAPPVTRHANLYTELGQDLWKKSAQRSDAVWGTADKERWIKEAKILWAGEIEAREGKITRINETAGSRLEFPHLFEGKGEASLAAQKLRKNIDTTSYMDSKFKSEKFDPNNPHLQPGLATAKYFRHDFRNNLVNLMTTSKFHNKFSPEKFADYIMDPEIQTVMKVAKNEIRKHWRYFQTLHPDLYSKQDLQRMKFYISKLLRDQYLNLEEIAQLDGLLKIKENYSHEMNMFKLK